jgi:hypothetical protein
MTTVIIISNQQFGDDMFTKWKDFLYERLPIYGHLPEHAPSDLRDLVASRSAGLSV